MLHQKVVLLITTVAIIDQVPHHLIIVGLIHQVLLLLHQEVVLRPHQDLLLQVENLEEIKF